MYSREQEEVKDFYVDYYDTREFADIIPKPELSHTSLSSSCSSYYCVDFLMQIESQEILIEVSEKWACENLRIDDEDLLENFSTGIK